MHDLKYMANTLINMAHHALAIHTDKEHINKLQIAIKNCQEHLTVESYMELYNLLMPPQLFKNWESDEIPF